MHRLRRGRYEARRIIDGGDLVAVSNEHDFMPAAAGVAVPLTFVEYIPGTKGPKAGLSGVGHIPAVWASMDGLSGEFEVDTGSRDALSLWTPFVKAHDLAARYRAGPEMVTGWGVGGSARARVARAGALMIGSLVIDESPIDMSTGKGHDPDFVAGSIGGEILRQFTVTFDESREFHYLKPNRHYGEPIAFDRSGMWINDHSGEFIVNSVVSGGPAEEAGLEVGNLISAVDGQPAAHLTLSGVREMLRQATPGTRIRLTVGQGKSAHSVILVARSLIYDARRASPSEHQ